MTVGEHFAIPISLSRPCCWLPLLKSWHQAPPVASHAVVPNFHAAAECRGRVQLSDQQIKNRESRMGDGEIATFNFLYETFPTKPFSLNSKAAVPPLKKNKNKPKTRRCSTLFSLPFAHLPHPPASSRGSCLAVKLPLSSNLRGAGSSAAQSLLVPEVP